MFVCSSCGFASFCLTCTDLNISCSPPEPTRALSTCTAVQAVPSLQGGHRSLPGVASPPSPAACSGWSWTATAGLAPSPAPCCTCCGSNSAAPCGCLPPSACRSHCPSASLPQAFLLSRRCGQFWQQLAGCCLLRREGWFPKGSRRGWDSCVSLTEKQSLMGLVVVWALVLV